jgi:hypothetical protein
MPDQCTRNSEYFSTYDLSTLFGKEVVPSYTKSPFWNEEEEKSTSMAFLRELGGWRCQVSGGCVWAPKI